MTSFATTILQKMLLDTSSDEHFDVKLLVDAEGTVLRAHRVVLSMVSDVFRKLFAGGMKAHCEGVVRVSDFTSSAVSESLALIYGGELSKAKGDWQLAGQVWDFGYRFQIDRVTHAGRDAALALLSQESCLRMLGFTVYIGDVEAVARIQQFIVDEKNFGAVVTSGDFTSSSYKTIASIQRPPRGAFVEKDTASFEKLWFDALVSWANSVPYDKDVNAQDAKRAARLQRALGLVDFSRMCTHELRECRANSTAAECPALVAALVSVLLARCEQMEQRDEGKGRELHDLDASYKETLQRKAEAERKLRACDERIREVVEKEAVARERAEKEASKREMDGLEELERTRAEEERLKEETSAGAAVATSATPSTDGRRSFLTALEMSESEDENVGMLRRAHSVRDVAKKGAVDDSDINDVPQCKKVGGASSKKSYSNKENDTTDNKEVRVARKRTSTDGKKMKKVTTRRTGAGADSTTSKEGQGRLQRASSSREGIKTRRRASMFSPSASMKDIQDSPFLSGVHVRPATNGAKPPTPPPLKTNANARRKSSPVVGRCSPPVAPQFPAPPLLLDTGRVL